MTARAYPTLKLTYFDAPGRAEPVRLVLRMAGIPFEDHRIDFAGFAALREQGVLPLGSVPVLEVDGLVLTQTAAMLRYAARLGGTDLYPSDPLEAFLVDSAIDTVNDTLAHALQPSMFERDLDKKLAMRKAFVEGPMAKAFTYLEGLIAKHGGPLLLGDRLSIADLLIGNQLAQIASGRLDGLSRESLAAYPRLGALLDAFQCHPRLNAVRG
jgi:glutathione S-transferase